MPASGEPKRGGRAASTDAVVGDGIDNGAGACSDRGAGAAGRSAGSLPQSGDRRLPSSDARPAFRGPAPTGRSAVPAEDPTRTLATERLTLRPFAPEDAPEVARLVDDPRITDVLFELPRPYGVDDATAWIESHEPARLRDASYAFAVCRTDGTLVGSVALRRSAPGSGRGELGYWTGPEHWGRGHASEAARAVVALGFDALGFDRIEARHLARNPASGRVLDKAGLTREAVLAGYLSDPRTGALEDMVQWAALADPGRRIVPAGPDGLVGARLGTVALLVSDYDVARDWFVERLGFRITEDTVLDETSEDGAPKRWVVVAPPAGGTRLLLARASSAEQRAALGRQGGGRVWAFLETDDFDRDHARFVAAGVAFDEAPRREPYGTVAVFRDVSGNPWDLIEPAQG